MTATTTPATGPGSIERLREILRSSEAIETRKRALRQLRAAAEDPRDILDDLRRALSDEQWEIREAACREASRLGASAIDLGDDLWAVILREDIQDVSLAARRALESIEGAAHISDRVISAMPSPDMDIAKLSTLVEVVSGLQLSQSAREQLAGSLWQLVCHPSYDISGAAFQAFASVVGNPATTLDRILKDPTLEAWRKGHFALMYLFRPELTKRWDADRDLIFEVAIATVDWDPDPDATEAAAQWLTDASEDLSADQRGELIRAARNAFRQRGFGALALRRLIGQEQLLEEIRDNPAAQQAFVRSLLQVNDAWLTKLPDEWLARLCPHIRGSLSDPSWEIRARAADWIGTNVQVLSDEDLGLSEEALQAAALDKEHEEARHSVEAALARVEGRKRAKSLRPFLEQLRERDLDLDTRLAALRALSTQSTREAATTLVREWANLLITNDSATLIDTAAELIIGIPATVPALVEQMDAELTPSQDDIAKVHQQLGISEDLVQRLRENRVAGKDGPTIAGWVEDVVSRSEEATRLARQARARAWPTARLARSLLEQVVATTRDEQRNVVRRHVTKQLAAMSDAHLHSELSKRSPATLRELKAQLLIYAVPALAKLLRDEDDLISREYAARALANTGGREAVEAVTRAVVGEERTQERRQQLLSDYYLKPSRQRSDEAATILRGAVREAKITLRILQALNIAVFMVGIVAMAWGLYVVLTARDFNMQLAGGVTTTGGLFGILLELIRNPIGQIQTAMSRLVQIETAFTSFIWELNLHGTYIQSQYVKRGYLTDEEIGITGERIQRAMANSMHLVATYTAESGPFLTPRLHQVVPPAGRAKTTVALRGENLQAPSSSGATISGSVVVDHQATGIEAAAWTPSEVRFDIPAEMAAGAGGQRTLWLSLIVNGQETNALPFTLVGSSPGHDEQPNGSSAARHSE